VTKRPSTISVADLSKAVEESIKIVGKKHKVQFAPGFHIGPGTIIGRQLASADISLKAAKEIATEITEHVTAAIGRDKPQAARFEPVVVAMGNGDGNGGDGGGSGSGGGDGDGTTVGMMPTQPKLEFD
jgi:hypothetical protein